MAESRVLILGDASSESLVRALTRPDRSITRTEDADEALQLVADNDTLIIQAVAPPRTAADVAREVRAVPGQGEIPILAVSTTDDVEERIALLEAGADDVISGPIDEREVEARVEALVLRFRRSKELRPGTTPLVVPSTRRPGHRLVVAFSPKGGAGTTTVAVNLALGLAASDPNGVALVDLAPAIGMVATHLDIQPQLTLADLANDRHAMEEPAALASYMTPHKSGLKVLAAPLVPGMNVLLGEHVGRILESLLATFATVVVDAGSQPDERALSALEAADDVHIVVAPEFAAIKGIRATFEYLADLGVPLPEPKIVVNELFAQEMLTLADIENALGHPVVVRIPHDPLLYQRAVNEGNPLLQLAPKSPPASRFEYLARVIVGEEVPFEPSTDGRRRRLGIFGRASGRA